MRDTLPLALRRIRTLLACVACASGCDSSTTEVLADDCTVGSPISLNVGEATHFEGASTATLCVSGASGQEEFLLVTASLAESGTVAINVQGDGLLTANGPPNPSPARVASAFAPQVIELDPEPRLQGSRFHAGTREATALGTDCGGPARTRARVRYGRRVSPEPGGADLPEHRNGIGM